MLHVTFHKSQVLELFAGGSVINGANMIYVIKAARNFLSMTLPLPGVLILPPPLPSSASIYRASGEKRNI